MKKMNKLIKRIQNRFKHYKMYIINIGIKKGKK